jgi:putative ABC transport system substrate-binding protein
MMRRREFITLLGGAAATWPLAARAQQPMIGLLSGSSPGAIPHLLAAFDLGLGEHGFLIGRDVTIEYHWAHGRFDRLRPWPPNSFAVR